MGQAEARIGRGEQSIAHIKRAFALSPRDPADMGMAVLLISKTPTAIPILYGNG
jgi:hypothetical protein